jgi:DNA-binding CsgD family transcriptional regulator
VTGDGIIDLYRAARTLRRGAFSQLLFAWMGARVRHDRALAVTAFVDRATCLDVHFGGVADVRTLVSGHREVRHLYEFLPLLAGEPRRAHRQDRDAPEYAGPRYAPLRDHLDRVGAVRSLFVAVPWVEDGIHTVVMLFRARAEDVFTDEEMATLEAIASHAVEALSVNRMRWLDPERADDPHALATATLSADGRLLQSTAAFTRLFWAGIPEHDAHVPAPVLAAVRSGRAWPLADGHHVVTAQADGDGGHVLHIRRRGPGDELAQRERQVAQLFAGGASTKAIAGKLGLSQATVRNHLQRVYDKLTVSSRDELRARLGAPTP